LSEAESPPPSPEVYQVLARKYRPDTFADLIGQEARPASRSTLSTRCTCSRQPLSTRCWRPSKSLLSTWSSFSPPPRSARCRSRFWAVASVLICAGLSRKRWWLCW